MKSVTLLDVKFHGEAEARATDWITASTASLKSKDVNFS